MSEVDHYAGLSHGESLRNMSLSSLRIAVTEGRWKVGDPPKHATAVEIIHRHEAAEAAELTSRSDARAEEMLSIAKTQASAASAAALAAQAQASAAFEQARWAKWAAVIAVVAAIIATTAAIKV